MLFVLTGDIQTGKTTWLEHLISQLESRSIGVQGVLAPGVWRSKDDPASNPEFVDANGYEKLGIDNVLLPCHERILFARRRDIAEELGLFDPQSQSAKAELVWHIDDTAIERVNAHLCALPISEHPVPALLVIDELGRLELLRNVGLTQAMNLLDRGPSDLFPHALVVIRDALLPIALERFDQWGTPLPIAPDEQSMQLVIDAFENLR